MSVAVVTLLGAITHQPVALWLSVRVKTESFVARFRAVPGTSYVGAIIVLYVLTFVLGAWIYTHYRFTARLALEQLRFFKTVGAFEMKEHLATLGVRANSPAAQLCRRDSSETRLAAQQSVATACRGRRASAGSASGSCR
jgi:hypothetical protein